MNYRKLGNSGLNVSEVALGTWLTFGQGIDDGTARACIETAFDHGVTLFDTADVYAGGEAERVLGQALRAFAREDIVVASKCFFPMSQNPNDRGLSRKHIIESVHKSLHRLDMDYLDLYQCHRFDPETPVAETVRAMDDLVRSGKILYWGVSQWEAGQIEDVVALAKSMNAAPPISNQPLYNMLNRDIERSVIPTVEKEGLGLIVYSPLAQGVLTGKYANVSQLPKDSRAADDKQNHFIQRVMTQECLDKAGKIAALAKQLGVSPADLALAWCLRQKAVSAVIIGASRPEQVIDNVRASGIQLTPEVVAQIDVILSQ